MTMHSSPYYLFGYERRYPYAWHGGPGGVPQGWRAASTRELGAADMIESGLDPNWLHYGAFKHTNLHDATFAMSAAMGDWPLVRPAGPEPLDPNQGVLQTLGINLSDNERLYGGIALAAIGGYVLWKKSKKRRNPARRRRRRRR